MNQDPNEKDLNGADAMEGQDEVNRAEGVDTTRPENEMPVDEQSPQPPHEEPVPQPQKPSEHHTNKAVWIVMIVFALLIGGGLGYIFGNNFATVNNSERDALQQQVTNLEADLKEANNKLDEYQSDTTEADKITELERENAALQQQVSDLEDQVADLEKQLEDAQTPSTTTPTDQ